MMPKSTAKVVEFLYPTAVPEKDFSVTERKPGDIVIHNWNLALGPIPDEQTIIDADADLVLVKGKTFSQFKADVVWLSSEQVVDALDDKAGNLEAILTLSKADLKVDVFMYWLSSRSNKFTAGDPTLVSGEAYLNSLIPSLSTTALRVLMGLE